MANRTNVPYWDHNNKELHNWKLKVKQHYDLEQGCTTDEKVVIITYTGKCGGAFIIPESKDIKDLTQEEKNSMIKEILKNAQKITDENKEFVEPDQMKALEVNLKTLFGISGTEYEAANG